MKLLFILCAAVLLVFIAGTKVAETRSKAYCTLYGLSTYLVQKVRNRVVPLDTIREKIEQIAALSEMPDSVRHYLLNAADAIYDMPRKDPEQLQSTTYKECMTKN